MISLNTSNKKNDAPKDQLRACFLYYSKFKFDAILYREAIALKEKGFEVDIICIRSHSQEKIFKVFKGLNLYGIQSRPSKEKSTTAYFLNLILFIIKAAILLSFLDIKKKYNLIHITSPPDIIVLASIIPKLFGTKIILDIHDIGPELYMRKLDISEDKKIIKTLKLFEKISTKFADHVITVNDLWKEKLTERSVNANKCSVLLNMADEEIFKPLNLDENKSTDSYNLFYHGTLDEHFGVDTILNAMQVIKKNIPNVILNIYGDGRLLSEFKKLINDLYIKDIVRFNDGVPFYELPKILQKADIGIVPTKGSIFSNEAMSGKALEYMALGIPVIISKTRVHDYYYDSSMVKFFEPDNKHELAMAVITLYQNEEERKRLVDNSQIFIQKYGWQQQKKVYFQIIDRLISNGPKFS